MKRESERECEGLTRDLRRERERVRQRERERDKEKRVGHQDMCIIVLSGRSLGWEMMT